MGNEALREQVRGVDGTEMAPTPLRIERRMNMDPKAVQRMTLEGMRQFLRMTFDTLASFQEQMERMWRAFLEQSGEMRKEGEKMLSEWLENLRKGREDLLRNLEEGLRRMEELLGQE